MSAERTKGSRLRSRSCRRKATDEVESQRFTGTQHKPREPPHPRRRGLHIVRNNVPKEHHCSHIPSLLLSAKNHARLTCSVLNALAAVRSRYQFFVGVSGPPSPRGEGFGFVEPAGLPILPPAPLTQGSWGAAMCRKNFSISQRGSWSASDRGCARAAARRRRTRAPTS